MGEQRKYPRLKVNLPVTIRYHGHLIPATALNVSCGGMCLSTDNPEVTGDDNVEVIFDISSADLDVSVRGRIVRVTPGMQKKVGVQFTNLYSIGHQAIERYVQSHNKN